MLPALASQEHANGLGVRNEDDSGLCAPKQATCQRPAPCIGKRAQATSICMRNYGTLRRVLRLACQPYRSIGCCLKSDWSLRQYSCHSPGTRVTHGCTYLSIRHDANPSMSGCAMHSSADQRTRSRSFLTAL